MPPGAASERRFDVFLSHNSSDKPAVERIAEQLKREGLAPWLDSWELLPGGRWQEELAAGLRRSAACAVFLGPAGPGDWEREEVGVALDRAATEPGFRVFLVLLPGLPEPFEPSALPPFLSTRTWVDLRAGLDDRRGLARLVAALSPQRRGDGGGPESCPYRGLEVFDEAHAALFFGREAEVQRLVEKLKSTAFLGVLGPSGSGKSSLVRAGLLPALRDGALPGSERWTIRVLRPGPRPLTTLAAHLLRLHPGEAMQATVDRLLADSRTLHLAVALARVEQPPEERVLWVVDQLEEVFTLCREEDERRQLLANLMDAAARPDGRNLVVVTLRADFYPRCAAYPELAARLAAHQLLVGPLGEAGLRQVIVEPARRVGLAFEDGLVETILADVARQPGARQPGALPLLEHALLELWRRRRPDGLLTLAAYRAAGGVEGSLARRADEVYGELPPERRELARRLLLRLTQPGEGAEDTRRRAPLDELLGLGSEPAAVDEVLDAAVSARLLTTSRDAENEAQGPWVEVSHEALIRGWPRLRGWVEEDRAGLRVHRRLTEAAGEWLRLGRDPEALYGGAQLAEAEVLAERHGEALVDLERRFLAASRRRARRRVRLTVGGLAALVAVFALFALFFLQERNRAVSRELAASALGQIEVDPEVALLLAVEAVDREPTTEAADALRRAVEEPQVLREWLDDGDFPADRRFSPDRRHLATREGEAIVVWEVESGEERLRRPAREIAWASDGRSVAFRGPGGMTVWDLATSRETQRWGSPPEDAELLAVSAGGHLVALRRGERSVRVQSFASSDGWATHLRGHRERVLDAAFGAAEGQVLTSSPGQARLWQIHAPRLLERFSDVQALAFADEARRLVVAASNRAVTWDLESGSQIAELSLGGDPDAAFGLTAGGRSLAMVLADGRVHVGAIDATAARPMSGPRDIDKLYLSADGRYLVTVDLEDAAQLWDVSGERPRRRLEHAAAVTHAVFSPDGSSVITSSRDGTAKLWRVDGGQAVVLPHPEAVFGAAFDPTGSRVATACKDGIARLWTAAGELLGELPGEEPAASLSCDQELYGVRFSPGGRSVLGWGRASSACLWSTESGGLIAELSGHEGPLRSAAFSRDGRLVLTTGYDGTARAWEAATGRQVTVLPRGDRDPEAVLAWSADGRQLAVAWSGGRVEIHACEVCRPVDELLELARGRLRRSLTEAERTRFLHEE